MITGNEILKDLESVKKKVEFAMITYSNNDIYPLINNKLEEIIKSLKRDKKAFRYN